MKIKFNLRQSVVSKQWFYTNSLALFTVTVGLYCNTVVAAAAPESPVSHPLVDFGILYGLTLLLVTLILGTVIWRHGNHRRRIFPATKESNWLNVIDTLDDPILLVDQNDLIVRGNQAFYQTIGKSPAQAASIPASRYCHPESQTTCRICETRRQRRNATLTLESDDPGNPTGRATEIRFRVVDDSFGYPVGMLQHSYDLTHIRNNETRLRKSETQFRALLDATPDPLIICDCNGNIVMVNQRCLSVFGYEQEQLLGETVEILLPATVKHKHVSLRKSFNQNPSMRPLGNGQQLTAQCRDGNIIPVDISLSPLTIDGELFIIAVVRDVSELKRHERELKRLASFPHLNPMPIIEVKFDAQNGAQISYLNPQAEFLFPDLIEKGITHEILAGLEWHLSVAKQTGKPQTRVIETGEQFFEQQICYVAEVDVAHINLWDVTAMYQLTNEMTYQASHDALTGLINRVEFDRRLRTALSSAESTHSQHAFCYIDLDRFKIVNDQCGHAAGDALLKQLAKIIKSKIRGSDVLARLGGDEFGLLLENCETGRAEDILQTILVDIDQYRFIWEQKSFSVGASVGLVMLSQHNGSISQVMQAADSACYMAKNEGGGRIHRYQPDDDALTRHTQNSQWAHKLQTALENNRFKLFAQSIHSLSDPQHIIHEVLVRMVDEEDNIISPAAFIPAAERYHLIQSIDRWVLRQTLIVIEKGWLAGSMCTINLSGDTIGDPAMLDYVIALFQQYRVDPHSICFEITETAMVTNLVQTRHFMSTLKELGCKFALDDFGSGVSSFAYLQNLPVDVLKIDGALVRDIAYNEINEVMVSSINTIGHAMQMKTIAEFVENEDIVKKLSAMGVDYGQGYYFSKPREINQHFHRQSTRKFAG